MTKALSWSARPFMPGKGRKIDRLVVVPRPTGFWVSPASDPDRYRAGPFPRREDATAWIETNASRD